ncbi:hypothetical protein [Actinomadura rubrobrunea]|nr:hypothetical protein [Actinomadura rubrobrunea]
MTRRLHRSPSPARGGLRGLDTGDDRYPAFASLPDGCRGRAQVRVIEE